MTDLASDPQIQKVMSARATDTDWQDALGQIRAGDARLTRRSVGEKCIKSFQRMLNFLGYSTASRGGFLIDGDFGRGTNRGIAQFQFDHRLSRRITRESLVYDCASPSSAQVNIKEVPEARLDVKTAEAMLKAAKQAIDNDDVTCGNFNDALFHLNKAQMGQQLECAEIAKRYGSAADAAIAQVREELGVKVLRDWLLAIIKTETGGIIKPRFEQHYLTRRARKNPDESLDVLRYESMSFGLGQVMGFNYKTVGAPSARAMLTSNSADQVRYVARYLAKNRYCKSVIGRKNPTNADFAEVARGYNGSGFAKHHYDEKIARWFREFRELSTT